MFVANSGRERTTAFVHGVGWTQHTIGSQYIRAASILQLLLGNMGRPGGGVMAMRGHASIQGSSDIPTLFDTLPATSRCRTRTRTATSTHSSRRRPGKGFWGNMRDYTVSLLKAWWGAAATAENDYCFDYLPRLTGSHSTYDTVMAQIDGTVKGYFLFGQNPAVGSANTRMQRLGMSKLDWLVVRDFSLIESATWWKDGPEIESGEMRTEDLATEVFFFPAAAHTEKNGTFTNTQRMVQWHHKAVDPQDDQRSDLWFIYHLGRLIREKLAGSTDEIDRPILDLTWDYPTEGSTAEPSAEPCSRRSTAGTPKASRSPPTQSSRVTGRPRVDAGSTAGATPTASTRRRGARRRASRTGRAASGPGRGRPTAGSSTTARRRIRRDDPGASVRRSSGGTPTSAGRSRHPRLPGRQATRLPPRRGRDGSGRDRR